MSHLQSCTIALTTLLALGGFLPLSVGANTYINLNLLSQGLLEVDSSAATSTDAELDSTIPQIETKTGENASPSSTAISEGDSLRVDRADVEEEIMEEGKGMAGVEADSVVTTSDLRAYTKTLLISDPNVEEVYFTDENVEVHYRQKGRLLALVPITFTVIATANANGEVGLKYPWFSPLTIDSQGEIEVKLNAAVVNALKRRELGSVRVEGEVDKPRFAASESAMVAAELSYVLRQAFEAWGQAVEE